MWESMGPISDRSKDRVGAQRHGGGGVSAPNGRGGARRRNPEGRRSALPNRISPHATISSYEGVVPKTTNWRSLGGGSEAPLERVKQTAK